MIRRPFRAAARRFLVWRYGKAMDWRCTCREIAQATAIGETSVRAICRQYGYPIERNHWNGGQLDVMPVDSYFAMTSPNLRNRY